jgi:hypothetical protein
MCGCVALLGRQPYYLERNAIEGHISQLPKPEKREEKGPIKAAAS